MILGIMWCIFRSNVVFDDMDVDVIHTSKHKICMCEHEETYEEEKRRKP